MIHSIAVSIFLLIFSTNLCNHSLSSTSSILIRPNLSEDASYRRIKRSLDQTEEKRKKSRLNITTTFKPASCKLTSQAGDRVTMIFEGSLLDTGEIFESRGDLINPYILELGKHKVLEGLEKGSYGMCQGESRILLIPPELGFGKFGVKKIIPPNSWLKFNIELLNILNREYINPDKFEIKTTFKPDYQNCMIKSQPNDTLSVLYKGTLKSNGAKFDEMTNRTTPLKFTLGAGQVIKGWDKGLKDMCIGEKRTLQIPAELAYGEDGEDSSEPGIPPDATLIFETELLGIDKGPASEEEINFQRSSWFKSLSAYGFFISFLEQTLAFL
ncbi:hypothetical protein BY996DRAFT_8391310 [Phakopsora pachyrhizi]|uniref:peptidylprolyl isomerase n=2 Tax=Phakopsora pachyrhizi TaxID=170000 RepID=A0AAV0B7K5_PHAPC|nr:hypothetical protein BY996DRAFT_8391310 [Phakopsora pachyrhizi]CAH7683114.1 expressed protein [Phakopsora pachyrhizi]